jgi:hypothetical protein
MDHPMDKHTFLLVEALRRGAEQPDGVRLYRSGKLAGLFEARTREQAAVADQAVRDGLLEIVRVETRGKTAVEWARVTPKGLDFLLHRESPARALADLRDALDAHRQGMPTWVAELRGSVEELQRRLAAEVESISARLDRLAERAAEAIQRLEQAQAPAEVPWAAQVLSLLEDREAAGLGATTPLADVFVHLRQRQVELSLKDFHQGLRRLHDRGGVQLLPDHGDGHPPAPEYALLDGTVVYHHVGRAVRDNLPRANGTM